MTTLKPVSEVVKELWNKMCEETCIACNGTGIHYDKVACSGCEGHGFETPEKYLTQALTTRDTAYRQMVWEMLGQVLDEHEDKGDERYGISKHVNTVLQRIKDDFQAKLLELGNDSEK